MARAGGDWLWGPRADRSALLLLSLLVLLPVHGPLLADPLRHYPDLVTAYPLTELARPGAWAGDPVAEMALGWGYPWLYQALLWVPLRAGLPLLLTLKLGSLLASLALPQLLLTVPGRAAARWGAAGGGLALALSMDSLHGFYPRAPGMLLTAGLLVALLGGLEQRGGPGRRMWLATLLAACSPFAYPMVFPPAAASIGLLTLAWWRQGRVRAGTVAGVGALLIASLGGALWRSGRMAAQVGPPCTAATCPDMPELAVAGNYTHSAAQGSLLLDNVLNLGEHTPAQPWVLLALLALALPALALVLPALALARPGRVRRGPSSDGPPGAQVVAALLAGSALAYGAITALTAWSPQPTGFASRAFVFSLPLSMAWAAGAGLDALAGRRRGLVALALLPPALALALVRPTHVSDAHPGWAPVYAAVAALPPEAVLGGHPLTLDPVPLLAGRRVVVIADVFNPWAGEWWRGWKTRQDAALDAFYAPDPARVRAWCEEWGATHLLVEGSRFDPRLAIAPRKYDWQPLADQIQARLRAGPAALAPVARPGEVCLVPCQQDWQGPCWTAAP